MVAEPGAGTVTECPELNCSPQDPAGLPIRFPFRLKGSHPACCGYPGFDLSCNNKNETMLQLSASMKLLVSKFDYKFQKLHVYDPDGCLPKLLWSLDSLSDSPFQFGDHEFLQNFTVFNCSGKQSGTWPLDISCVYKGSDHSIIAFNSDDSNNSLSSLISCTKLYNVSLVPYDMVSAKPDLIITWSTPNCISCEAEGKLCKLNRTSQESKIECLNNPNQHGGSSIRMKITGGILGSFFLGLVIALYHFHKLNKAEKENQKRIGTFLEDYKALKPARYTYADIKRITNQFKDQLGEGVKTDNNIKLMLQKGSLEID